jgi:hypothetical protein
LAFADGFAPAIRNSSGFLPALIAAASGASTRTLPRLRWDFQDCDNLYNPSANAAGNAVNSTIYVNPIENYSGNVTGGGSFPG